MPRNKVSVLDVGHGEVLQQIVDRRTFIFGTGRASANTLGRKYVEEKAQMG